ncbi:AAA family ATPase [Candidatus Magnetominusculus dajiuhuensis]|uniref:AAA family ATPase n=1 Tax=Candidatus Magnetominusculus dajiuhuensis TaxID=3137712 RepID=UPI003B43C342
MQRLIIKNFGPIEEVDLNINDIMLFIGPQASGKSTISKAVYFFKSLKYELFRYVLSPIKKKNFEVSIDNFDRAADVQFVAIFGPIRHLSNTYLKYEYKEGVDIEITIEEGNCVYHFSEAFRQIFTEIINKVKSYASNYHAKDPKFLSSSELYSIGFEEAFFESEIEDLANELFSDKRDVVFFPAGRSLLSILSDQRQNIDFRALDLTMAQFVERINISKTIFSLFPTIRAHKQTKLTQAAQDVILKILKATYRFEDDEDRLYFSNTGHTRLSFASSGQQEAIWILLFIREIIQEDKDFFSVFEEPEAHLYPETQKDIIDLICLLSNLNNNQIIITTHSPYILSSFNNLLYAYTIYKKGVPDVNSIVSKELWINPDRLDAYFVDKGRVRSIIDEEYKLIKTEEIDSASQIIDEVYSKLFDIDP